MSQEQNPSEVANVQASQKRRLSVDLQANADVLEKQLKGRQTYENLQSQGIVKPGGLFASQKAALEREMAQNNVGRSLEARPTLEELIDSGVIESDRLAPSLHSVAKKLERGLIENSINQKLYSRPDPEELQAHGFIGDKVAPRLQAAKRKLETALIRDQLAHLLESRPDIDQLVEHNILHNPEKTLSSKIEGISRQLERRMTADKIGHLLEKRAELEDLEAHNYMADHRVAPSIQGAQKKLERELLKSNLYHALIHRRSRAELEARHILTPEDNIYSEDVDLKEESEAYAQSARRVLREEQSAYQRRSKNFILTRILLKFVAHMAETGEITLQQKGFLKDLIVDQSPLVLAAAEVFEYDSDANEFKDTLLRICADKP